MAKKPSWKIWIRAEAPKDGWDLEYHGPVGSMMDYDGHSREGWEEREPFEFTATLTLDDFYRGRSAAGFVLRGPNQERYIIRMSELTKALKGGTMMCGVISGTWGFVKQGANYSLTYLGN